MVKAGFDSVFLGIETLEEKSLHECNKTQNIGRDLIIGVKRMQRLGLQVTAGFILGFDSDSTDTFQKQMDFIQESGIVSAMVGLLNAERGTKLYQRLQEENRLAGETIGDNTNFFINFIPKMGYQQLMEGYKYVVHFIYSPRPYYARLLTFLKNYNSPERGGPTFQISDIKAFIRAIWTLGAWGEERYYYWKILLWTVLRRPNLFSLGVRLSIYGYHFRKVFSAPKLVDSE